MNANSVNTEEHPQQYFLPGQMILHVEHSLGAADLNLVELAHSIDRNVNERLGFESQGRLIKKVQPRNILTFTRRSGPPFSIVPIEVDSKADLLKILLDLEKKLKTGPVDLGQGATWQASSPNWLLGSAGHGAPHPPSPGSWPVAQVAPAKQNWKFSLMEENSVKTREWPAAMANEGGQVYVAILDTAPLHTDLDEAYEHWHGQNELIDRLLKPEPNRKLRVAANIYAEIELTDCSLARHRYWMADHGLFIASEIASIAPEAELHLYKVFTSYGSASTLTLAQGLLQVLTDLADGVLKPPLLVNFSGGLAVPKAGTYDPDFHPDFPVELQDPVTLENMQTSLRELFDELTNHDQVIVVAAAGDDTELNKPRPPARLPAAYERVIGVGAMPRVSKPHANPFPTASYSNLADNPPSDGYVTLGGEHGAGKGVIGLFTSEIPYFPGQTAGKRPQNPEEAKRDHLKYKQNLDGSVEWAGASFAAPIITGILARWCGEQVSKGVPITLADARAALNNLSQGLTTAQDEHVILVTQGPPP